MAAMNQRLLDLHEESKADPMLFFNLIIPRSLQQGDSLIILLTYSIFSMMPILFAITSMAICIFSF
jgi:hypothetical protein